MTRQPFKARTPTLDRMPPPGGIISAINPAARQPGHVTIRIGRRVTGLLRADDAQRLNVRIGDEWSEDLRVQVSRAIDLAKARGKALRAAASRPMSAEQLRRRLTRRRPGAIDNAAARAITDDLSAKGVLNDAAFARAAADSEIRRKPAGKSFLRAKLRSKGIDADTADAAIDAALADAHHDPKADALELARRKQRSLARLAPEVAQRRLYAALARRGFDPDACRFAVRKVLGSGRNMPDTD